MADPDPPPDRLSSLRRQVKAARGEGEGAGPQKETSASSLAFRFGGEFGAAILVGALLGYGIDYFLHTNGVALAIGLALGFAAGVVNVVRLARAYSAANPPDRTAPPVRDEEDD